VKPDKKLHPQYITDEAGQQTGVILSLEEYNELLEDLGDLARAAERVDEPAVPHERVVRELREDGYLSD
jgi:PHD/YefM family antitoxin component YafN of YafNO toxin-antitoxin module